MSESPGFGWDDEGRIVPNNQEAELAISSSHDNNESGESLFDFSSHYERIVGGGFESLRDWWQKFKQEPEFDPSKRKFIRNAAVATVGTAIGAKVVAEGIDWWKTREFDPKLIERVNKINLKEIHRFSESFESINDNFISISHFNVGDYDGPTHYSHEQSQEINSASTKSERLHNQSADIRSNAELMLLSTAFLKTDSDFSAKMDNRIKRNIANNPDQADKILIALEQIEVEMREPTGPLSLGDLMGLLQILQTRKARDYVIDYIGDLVANGQIEDVALKPITEEEEAWRQEQPRVIYRDTLMWAKNMEPVAQLLLEAAPEIWFDGLSPDEQRSRVEHIRENGISNAGGIAMLMSWETQNMTHVGDAPAISQAAATRFKKGKEIFFYPHYEEEMNSVLGYVEDNYHISYSQPLGDEGETVGTRQVGSLKRGFASGGAIFGQFMAVNLRLFIEKYEASRKKVKELLDIDLPPALPGSPAFMTLFMQLYINGQWRAIDVADTETDNTYVIADHTKGGYKVGDSQSQIDAWESWNNHSTEVEQTHNAANSYYTSIIKPASVPESN